MPGLLLTLSGSRNPPLVARIVPALTSLTCDILKKRPEATMVMVRYVLHEDWFIESRSLADYGKNSFRLEVTITDETNTKEQKAMFHRSAFDLLSGVIGNIHPHSNIHICDVRASAYGYGGFTQEYRLHHPK